MVPVKSFMVSAEKFITVDRDVSVRNSLREKIKARFLSQGIEMVTFASSSTVRNFVELFGGPGELKKILQHTIIGCIGPITAETVLEQGLHVDVVAEQNTIPALVEALVAFRQQSAQATVLN